MGDRRTASPGNALYKTEVRRMTFCGLGSLAGTSGKVDPVRMSTFKPTARFRRLPSIIGALLLLVSGAFLASAAGCAGTATEKSTGEYIDDGVITTRVKTALLRDDVTPGTDIKVETYRGVVQLSGFVNTLNQKNRADEIARAVPGVQQIVNNIVVK
jgi:hyperosmotically inducible protein